MKKIFILIFLFINLGINFAFADYDYCNPKNEGIEKLFSTDFFEKENISEGGEKEFFEKFYKDKEYICFDGKIATIKENENILSKDFEYIKDSYKNNSYKHYFRIKNSLYYNSYGNFNFRKDFSKYFDLKDGDIKSEKYAIFKVKDKFFKIYGDYFYEILDGKEVNIDLVSEFNLDKKSFWEKNNYFGDKNKVYFRDEYYGKKDKKIILENADSKTFRVFESNLAYDKNAIYISENRNEIDFDYDTLELHHSYASAILLDKNRGYLLKDKIKIISKYRANSIIYFSENQHKISETLFYSFIILSTIFLIFFRNSIIPFIVMVSYLVISKIFYYILDAEEFYIIIITFLLVFFIFHFIIYILIWGKRYGIKLFNSVFTITNISLSIFFIILYYELYDCKGIFCGTITTLIGLPILVIIYIITNIVYIIKLRKEYKNKNSKEKKETKKLEL